MRNRKKLPKKCEWKGCEKKATTSLAFGKESSQIVTELCDEHAQRRSRIYRELRETESQVKIWWWCERCERVFEAPYDTECRYCKAGEGTIWPYSRFRQDRPELPPVPEEGARCPAYVWRPKRFSREHVERVVTVDDLLSWISRSSEKERWYIRAKVDLKTKEGVVTMWLRTVEIRAALADDRIVKCHGAEVSVVNVEEQRLWQKLRNRILRLYGRRCMRCGRTDGQLHLDHIQNWQEYPERRYDPENVQLLCRDCHTWKHRQVREWDFRPKPSRK